MHQFHGLFVQLLQSARASAKDVVRLAQIKESSGQPLELIITRSLLEYDLHLHGNSVIDLMVLGITVSRDALKGISAPERLEEDAILMGLALAKNKGRYMLKY